MKKIFAISVFLLLAFSLVLAGCGGKDPAPATGEKDPAPAKVETIELKLSDWSPDTIPTGQPQYDAIKEIAEKTQGRVKITPYFNGSLVPFRDAFKGVASGISDITVYQVDVTQGAHVLNRIFNLPVTFNLPTPDKTSKIYAQLVKEFPELQQENQKVGVKWLALQALPGYHVSMTKKLVKIPADLKGVKVSVGGSPAEMVAAVSGAGAGVVAGAPTETYTNLEKGVIDGQIFHYPAIDAFKNTELEKKNSLMGNGLAQGAFGWLINEKSWNRLTPEDQKIVQEAFDKCNEVIIGKNIAYEKQILDKLKADKTHEVYTATPAELQQWFTIAQPQVDKWIKDTEAKGFPAQKIYDRLKQLMTEAAK